MRRAGSLLETIQSLLERTYGMHTGLDEVGSFVIGDRGLRRLYAPAQLVSVGSAAGQGARLLVREVSGEVRVCVYFPDEQIRRLEDYPPQHGLREENVDAFATLVEELDHLLLLAARARAGREVSLFELELHANVSKHLVLARFLAGKGRPLDGASRLWLRHHLYHKVAFADGDPEVQARYENALRWAVKLVDALPRLEVPARIRALRRFHRAGASEKLELILRLAA